ncbi:MAG: hypothetical protein KF901_29280 [Myxococcales bacterium]|nr:hypothetical protein [Myxococcales bacterium]
MIVRKAALRPVPTYAVIEAHTIHVIEGSLDEDEDSLQDSLDQGFAELDRRQPALAEWLADELARTQDELVQSLGYFLAVTVYLAFREAFPTRLREVDPDALQIARETLHADEQIRAEDPSEILDSDDVIAMSQPALVAYVQHHVDEALDQGEGDIDLDELERIYRAILVQVIALSHAVASPTGELGPTREMLA